MVFRSCWRLPSSAFHCSLCGVLSKCCVADTQTRLQKSCGGFWLGEEEKMKEVEEGWMMKRELGGLSRQDLQTWLQGGEGQWSHPVCLLLFLSRIFSQRADGREANHQLQLRQKKCILTQTVPPSLFVSCRSAADAGLKNSLEAQFWSKLFTLTLPAALQCWECAWGRDGSSRRSVSARIPWVRLSAP